MKWPFYSSTRDDSGATQLLIHTNRDPVNTFPGQATISMEAERALRLNEALSQMTSSRSSKSSPKTVIAISRMQGEVVVAWRHRCLNTQLVG